MGFSDIWSGAATGATTGAGVGAMSVNPYGIGIGAGVGALVGGVQGYFRGKQKNKQQQALGEARMRLEQLARDQRSQRTQDLERALGYFQPAQAEMTRLYGG